MRTGFSHYLLTTPPIVCYNSCDMKRHINLPNQRPNRPFSDAVLVDGTLYLSGRIGFVPGTSAVPDDPAQEARYMLDGFRDVLAAADMTMDDIVSLQIFTPDVSLFDLFNGVYRSYF